MTDTQMAVREAQTIARGGFDDATIDLIRATVSDPRNPLSSDEFTLFLAVCRHTGLNPLLKEIYATKIDGRFTVLTGIDGYRRLAQSSPRFRGMAGPLWCGQDGVWRDAWLDQTPPTACKVGVYVPGSPEPTWGVAYFKNYRTRKTPTWQQMPEHMLAVRAEAFALRKVFGREIGAVALPADDEQWSAATDRVIDEDGVIHDAPDPGPSPRMTALRQHLDYALAEGKEVEAADVAADLRDEEERTQHEQEQPPPTDPLAAKRAEALDYAARCRAAGVRTADPHPQATEVALDGYIAAQKRMLNARAAKP